MATDRTALLAVPAAAASLLWPALWNGYPIVFADTGTYLSQAIQHYASWDRPVFYSLFMLPLHATVTVWPVVVVQALLAAWLLWMVARSLLPDLPAIAFIAGIALLSLCTWLPWLVSELMPDLFTPLLVVALCLLVVTPERSPRWEQAVLMTLTAFMIATQLSSVPLACLLLAGMLGWDCAQRLVHRRAAARSRRVTVTADTRPAVTDGDNRPSRRDWRLILLPPALAILALCSVNLAAHGRFSIAPFGNVFLLARVIYDGPGMAALRRGCPAAGWRLCPFVGRLPANSDDFLWTPDSPLLAAGGAKAVSLDAGAIIRAAVLADPADEIGAVLTNSLRQLTRFGSGDGLGPWPDQVTPVIEHDFPAREQAAYASARQQAGSLFVPAWLAAIHRIIALGGVAGCLVLLPVAVRRHAPCSVFLFAVLLTLPVSAAITGGLSAPHERYQARIMWLPPFVAVLSLAALRRQPA
ncbi:MAG TPA: hypothetical protein VGC09_03065 [Rhodopila sp.]